MARVRSNRGEGARLRDELLDAAEQLLAEHGDERDVTIRAIVGRAGVTPPALYLHFPDKQALIREVVVRGFEDLARTTAAAAEVAGEAAGEGGAVAALRAGVLAYLGWAERYPGRYRALFDARRETQLLRPDGTGTSVAFDGLVARIAAVQAAGAARGGDPERIATLLWAAEHGLATLRVARDRFPWPPPGELVDGLLVTIVGVDPAALPTGAPFGGAAPGLSPSATPG